MKKQMISRGLLGVPIGVTVGYSITILISLGWGQGSYHPCAPELIQQFGSEIAAVLVQLLLMALLGAVIGAASVIWEMDHWSIAKQTGIYFALFSITMLPIAFVMHWMEHSVAGFLLYFGVFFVVFIIMWVGQYLAYRHKIKKINEQVQKRQ